LQYGGGYDHNWNLDQEKSEGLKLAAEALDTNNQHTDAGLYHQAGNPVLFRQLAE
jgi:hypothetical protein